MIFAVFTFECIRGLVFAFAFDVDFGVFALAGVVLSFRVSICGNLFRDALQGLYGLAFAGF